MKLTAASPGTCPYITEGILEQATDTGVGQAVFIVSLPDRKRMNLVRRTEKLLGQIHYGNAAEFHGYPKSVVIQLTYIIYTVRYAVGFVVEGDETFRFRVKQYHSSIGSYPYVSAFVFVDTCHFVAGQGVGVLSARV